MNQLRYLIKSLCGAYSYPLAPKRTQGHAAVFVGCLVGWLLRLKDECFGGLGEVQGGKPSLKFALDNVTFPLHLGT